MTTTEAGPLAIDPELAQMMDAVFAEYRTDHPPTGQARRDEQLWARLDGLGLARLTGSEETGGSGAGWFEAAELMTAAARHAVRIPLAENDVLAGWLLEAVGIGADSAIRTVATLDENRMAHGVPWASTADRVVLLWHVGEQIRTAEVDRDALQISAGVNQIGEPRDSVSVAGDLLESLTSAPAPAAVVSELELKAALVRCIQVCAALDTAVALAVEHTSTRVQFGRPLAKFQAVQNLVADSAAEAALARAATEAALSAAVHCGWSVDEIRFRVAAARSCAGHAASVVVRNIHQALGAIGTTHEHRLHQFTRAALAWRSEFGSVRHWDEQVTAIALQVGGDRLWNLIAG
ncbi:acyl-CoA dehydrogenase [Mycolicibacterium murale]|uniref:Acyl-CoA dehydrogenase n=2 Tax=Mycolicibacterium murale TaxID=182220 RepID=A0A7I9WNS4_9MYCO|nr:acyl-CoA dehydrogenase [Mycolicibacterium murale]